LILLQKKDSIQEGTGKGPYPDFKYKKLWLGNKKNEQ
jgi:hypothetical protein